MKIAIALFLFCSLLSPQCSWSAEDSKETPEKPKPQHGGILDPGNCLEAVFEDDGITVYAIKPRIFPDFNTVLEHKITRIIATVGIGDDKQAEGEVTLAADAKSFQIKFKDDDWKQGKKLHFFFQWNGGHFVTDVSFNNEDIKRKTAAAATAAAESKKEPEKK